MYEWWGRDENEISLKLEYLFMNGGTNIVVKLLIALVLPENQRIEQANSANIFIANKKVLCMAEDLVLLFNSEVH